MKIFFLIILFIANFANCQNSINEKYISDFNVLTTSLDELSPIFYRKLGKDKVIDEIVKTKNNILNSNSKEEVLLHIQNFLFIIGDGHIFNSTIYDLSKINKALPFNVYIHEGKLYIKNFPEHTELNGQEILELNSIKSKKIIDSLSVFFTNDGGREHIPFHYQIFFNNLYSNFISHSDTITIKISDNIYHYKMLKKKDTNFYNIVNNQFENYLGQNRFLKSTITPTNGYFYFLGFQKQLKNHHLMKEFKTFIKKINEQKVPNLIIDLRYNAGGDPALAAKMCRYLSVGNFKTYENSYITKVRKPTFLKYMKNKKMYFFRNFGVKNEDSLRKRIIFDRNLTKTNKPKKKCI